MKTIQTKNILKCGLGVAGSFLAVWALVSCTETPQATNTFDEGAPAPKNVLNYEFPKHLSGLGWDVIVVKTPDSVVARRDNGSVYDWYELVKSDGDAWRKTYGGLSEDLKNKLDTMGDDDRIDISLMFDPLVDWSDAEPKLKSADLQTRGTARTDLAAKVKQQGDVVVPTWESAGLSVDYRSELMPLVVGTMRVADARKLAMLPSVSIAYDATPGVAVSDSSPNSQSDPGTDVELNSALGLTGAGQNVGVIEEPNCGVYAGHDAFSLGAVTHETALQTCSTDGDCFNCTEEVACAGGHCISTHANHVASAVLSTRGGTVWGAGKAHYWAWNHDFGGHTTRCYQSGTDQAYHWFTDPTRKVTTVVQSYSCYGTPTSDGVIEDYYARKLGVLTVKSSGDNIHSPDGIACPGTLNSLCVGGATAGGAAWDGDGSYYNSAKTDRDEPDLTALSVNVDVAGTTSVAWVPDSGTSFSTPAVAAIATLLKEGCPSTTPTGEIALRAILEAASWSRNPGADYRYATPTFPTSVDQKDGAGGLTAADALSYCSSAPGGPNVFQGGGLINVSTAGGTTPTNTNTGGLGIPPKSHTVPSSTDGLSYAKLQSLGTLAVGNRVRIVFAWDSCPSTSYTSQNSPAKVATDFDLLLLDETANTWEYGSQSVDDSVEGFDYKVLHAHSYSVWYRFKHSTTGCNGNVNEDTYWAGVIL